MFLNQDEKKILQSYVDTYINSLKMDSKTAKQVAKMNIVKSKERAISEGLYDLPADYWKEIFEMEKNNIDNFWTKYYKRARKDGVQDEDIIYLWETYPVERFMLQETQNLINMNVMLTALNQGKTMEQATETVRKNFPTYGNPNEKTEYGTEEDNPLPLEFVFKVNKNIISGIDSAKHKEALKEFSSFNACIRFLARNDKLGKV
jgi:hypothetical protein